MENTSSMFLESADLKNRIAEISRLAYEDFRDAGYGDRYDPQQFIEPLRNLLRDNTGKTPEELQEMARPLTPGSVRDNCILLWLTQAKLPWICPKLQAAIISRTWGGGRYGFQHMPDPRAVDEDEYEFERDSLIDMLDQVRPEDVLVGKDRAFYDALPERFTIYRGGHDVSSEMVGLGVCWTTRREIAEWFALRGLNDQESYVLVSARARKSDVRLAFAVEYEVVLAPSRWRELKRPKPKSERWRPELEWFPSK